MEHEFGPAVAAMGGLAHTPTAWLAERIAYLMMRDEEDSRRRRADAMLAALRGPMRP